VKLIIISGRSGSGKSTVLNILEDRGYYCIDNLPASLLPALAHRLADNTTVSFVAVSIDARNISSDLTQVPEIITELRLNGVPTDIIFLNANSPTLLKRFSENRRKHPLTSDTVGLREAVDTETKLLEEISVMASLSIDTSDMSIHQLREYVKTRLTDPNASGIALLFESFGYKKGVPVDADVVYDVRCLPNPYWDTNLRPLTGLDKKVQEYLESQLEVNQMIDDIKNYLERWLPLFEENNRSYMTVAIGCTGGQHRSVYISEQLGRHFTDSIANVQIRHRELSG